MLNNATIYTSLVLSMTFNALGTIPVLLNPADTLKEMEAKCSNTIHPERYVLVSTLQEAMQEAQRFENAISRIDTPQMLYLHMHIDEIAKEISSREHTKQTLQCVEWLLELRPIMIQWVNNLPLASVRTMHDVLHTTASKEAIEAINAWWRKGKKLLITTKYPHTTAAIKPLMERIEAIVAEKYAYLARTAHEITIDAQSPYISGRYINSLDKNMCIRRIHELFDWIATIRISEEHHHAQRCEQLDRILTAIALIIKDDALWSDVQKSIDQQKSKNVLHALMNTPVVSELIREWNTHFGVTV